MISAGISNKERQAVYRRDGFMCAICGDTRHLQIHHHVKRSSGGTDRLQNLITLCAQCHGIIHCNLPPVVDYLTVDEMRQTCVEYLGDLYAEEVWEEDGI